MNGAIGLKQRVRVARPAPNHQHMRGQVGMVLDIPPGYRTKRTLGTRWVVMFLGGRSIFRTEELEVVA